MVALGVAVCTSGACHDATDMPVGDAGSTTDNFGVVGAGLAGFTVGQMNLQLLVYWTPELV